MLIEIILLLAAVYLLFGLVFAIAFVIKGVKAVDNRATSVVSDSELLFCWELYCSGQCYLING